MKKMLRRLPWILLVLALAGAVTYGFWPVPIEVDSVTATTGTLLVTVNEDGKTRIREKYEVSAPVGGKLLRLSLRPGDEVAYEETVLAVIEPNDSSLLDPRAIEQAEAKVRVAKAMQQQSESAVKRAAAAYELAKSDLARIRKSYKSGALTESEFDKATHQERMAAAEMRSAEFGMNVAKFELELAKAALVRARPRKKYNDKSDESASQPMTIRAPVSGRVLRVFQESSSVVTPGLKLLELGDPRDLEMEIDVLSTDAVPIRPGAKVFIEHWGGEGTLHGVVRLVEPSGFLKVSALGVEEQRVNVIADFTEPLSGRQTLGDGYRIEARIVVSERKDILKVPSGALFREGGNWFVFQILEGRAVRRAVEIGKSNGVETEILKGISKDDRLILHPTDKIKDGIRVESR